MSLIIRQAGRWCGSLAAEKRQHYIAVHYSAPVKAKKSP